MRLIRILFALGSVAILAWRACHMMLLVQSIDLLTSVASLQYNEITQKGIDVIIAQSDSWAQATTILIGVLAALWVAKGDEPQLALRKQLWPEIIMWCAGAFTLLLGLYCQKKYLGFIAHALEVGGATARREAASIPDVFSDPYEALRTEQMWLLIFGAAMSAFAVFSVRHLSGAKNDNQTG
jgi:hypothetical protein